MSDVELSSLSEEGPAPKKADGPRTRRPMFNPAKAWVWRKHAAHMGSKPAILGIEGVAPNKWFKKLVRRGVKKGLMEDAQKWNSVATCVRQSLGKVPG